MRKLFPALLRWVIAIGLVGAGAGALLTGVSFDGMYRVEGIPARIEGLTALLAGIYLCFAKNALNRKDNDPPDLGG